MKRNNKAITLIALVITIVVLIILAAVAINLSLGNNGIFNRAKTAKEQYQNAETQEQAEVAKSTNQIDSYVGGNRNINDNIKVIKTKTPSIASTYTKVCDYPEGYTASNCTILSFKIQSKSTPTSYYETPGECYIYTNPNEITMWVANNSNYFNTDLYIVLYKFQ